MSRVAVALYSHLSGKLAPLPFSDVLPPATTARLAGLGKLSGEFGCRVAGVACEAAEQDQLVHRGSPMYESPESLKAQAATIMADLATRCASDSPRINDAAFPENDRKHVDTILLMMNLLNGLIDRFSNDLELFDYAEEQELGHRWSAIACRDAALALSDFKDALGCIKDATEQCLRLCTPPLLAAIKATQASFKSALPDATGSRHVAAHSAEHIGTPDNRERNTLSHVPILMQLARNGRIVISTRQGRYVSFEISSGTLAVLKSARTQVFDAFRSQQQK
jgi:hypothetical protein